jgi:fatty acid desaturase
MSLFKEPKGLLANGAAMAYVFAGYSGGFALMAHGGWLSAITGVLLTAHTMFIAAYLLHEACHDAIFLKHAHNRVAGELMSFVAGSSYASYERIRHLHLRHHRERIDVSCFDYREFLWRRPEWVRRVVLALEWAYVPAVEALMHLQVILRPVLVKSDRRYVLRVLSMLVIRLGALALLTTHAPRVLPLYLVAYALLMTLLGFFDAFQHTYDCFITGKTEGIDRGTRSREYEQVHTYSNVFTMRHPWINVLALNFGYHNAHHERAGTPWYRLPALHREVFTHDRQVLPVRELLFTFHKNRVRRVFDEGYGTVNEGPGRADDFVGARGVSFLTVV